MSIDFELTEDELNVLLDVQGLVGLIDSLAVSMVRERIDIGRAELCAFTNIIKSKLVGVTKAVEERQSAQRVLNQSMATSRVLAPPPEPAPRRAKRARREAAAA